MAGSRKDKNPDYIPNGDGNFNNIVVSEWETHTDTIHPRFHQNPHLVSDGPPTLYTEAICLSCKDTFLIKERNDVDEHYLSNLHNYSTATCFYCKLYVFQYQVDNDIYNYHSCKATNVCSKK